MTFRNVHVQSFYSCPKVSTSNATFKIVNFCGKEINITNTIYILFSQTSESLFIIVNENRDINSVIYVSDEN